MKSFLQKIVPEIKIMHSLAVPIIIGQLGIMLMGVADTVQVGHMSTKAKESIGAAGIANGIYIAIAIIGIIALQIIAPLIANASTQNNKIEMKNLFVAGNKVALILATICFILIEIVAYNFEILNQKTEIKKLAIPYLHIIAVSVFPMLLFTSQKQLADGLGHTKIAMFITIIALIINVILNYLLIYGIGFFPELGLLGAGIATLISRVFMALGLFIYLNNNSYFNAIFTEKIDNILQISSIKKILKIGIPSGFQGFFEIAVFSAAAILIGQFGAEQLAAHQVAINPASLTYMMVTGVAAAGSIRVGTHLNNNSAMKLSGSAALIMGFIFMGFCALIMLLFNVFIAKLYINDTQVLPLAASLIFIAAFFQLSDGIQAVALGILRGMADVNIPTIITLIAYWVVGLPIGWYLAFYKNMEATGFWIGLVLGLTVSAALLTWRFYHNLKKQKN